MADATQEEILCAFMEPKPRTEEIPQDALECILRGGSVTSGGGWWIVVCHYDEGDIPRWIHRTITLNECHEIEARLTDGQWRKYENLLEIEGPPEWPWQKRWIHASVEQKIKALGAVLREQTKGAE